MQTMGETRHSHAALKILSKKEPYGETCREYFFNAQVVIRLLFLVNLAFECNVTL